MCSIYFWATKPHCYHDDDDYSLCRHQSIQTNGKENQNTDMKRESNAKIRSKTNFPVRERKLDGVSIFFAHF